MTFLGYVIIRKLFQSIARYFSTMSNHSSNSVGKPRNMQNRKLFSFSTTVGPVNQMFNSCDAFPCTTESQRWISNHPVASLKLWYFTTQNDKFSTKYLPFQINPFSIRKQSCNYNLPTKYKCFFPTEDHESGKKHRPYI